VISHFAMFIGFISQRRCKKRFCASYIKRKKCFQYFFISKNIVKRLLKITHLASKQPRGKTRLD